MTTTEPAQTANPETNGHRTLPGDVATRAARLLIADTTKYTLDDIGNARRLVSRYADVVAWVPEFRTWRIWNGDRWIDDAGDGRMRSIAHRVTEDMRSEAAGRAPKIGRAMELAKEIARREIETQGDVADNRIDKAIEQHQLVKDVERARRELMELDDWIHTSRFHKYLNAMTAQATGVCGDDGRPRLEVNEEYWDTDLRLLNVANGTLLLGLDGAVLRPHDMADRLTQICQVSYNPLAVARRWKAFLEWAVPDEELRLQIQVKLGQSLYGGNPQQQFIMLLGPTRSGKTTVLETVAGVLGPDYASSYDPSLLRAKREAAGRPDMVAVLNKRFIYTIEPSDGWTVDAEQIKKISGGDTIKVRDNYARAKEFKARRPAFTPWLGSNRLPIVRGADRALEERTLVHPFTQYRKVEERDLYLVETLIRDEAEGILAWLIEGYNLGCRQPELLTKRARLSTLLGKDVQQELSLVRKWIAEVCETCKDHQEVCEEHHGEHCKDCEERGGTHCKKNRDGHCEVHCNAAGELWTDWKKYCEDNNHDPGNSTSFGNDLNDLGYLNRNPVSGKDYYTGSGRDRKRIRRGLRLRPLTGRV